MQERDIQNAIRLAASSAGMVMFRNNVGTGYTVDGNRIQFGLCPGSSDLIGWTPVTITPEHVGTVLAQFTAIEVKTATGRIRPDQQRFIDAVNAAGGRGIIARKPEDI